MQGQCYDTPMGDCKGLRVIALSVCVFLSACAAAGREEGKARPIEAVFVCGGYVVHTAFRPERMTLTLGHKRYRLERARSGSGAHYTGASPDGPVEFWNKGRDARLTIGSRTFPECHERRGTR